ncbi:MAG: SulP family inorganic anion transporter [Anaerolineaceae bacterium]|nr:SulP family inorganic anion transporter [Anaerolineaceae bacterium]
MVAIRKMNKISYSFDKANLRADLLAGLTGAVAGAPQAMGFALIAGVSPVYGLYAAFVSTIVGTLTSSSTLMTIGPTNALALVVFSTLGNTSSVSIEKMAVLSLLVGVFQVAFGLLRLGDLTRFVSNAVMTGFIAGAGLLIILGQLAHVSGYDPQTIAGWPEQLSSSLPRFFDWLVHLPQSQPHTLVIGVAAIIIIDRLHHTRLRNIATLVAIFVTTVFILVAGWSDVAIVAHVPQGWPAPILPPIQFAPELLSDALALAMLALVQSAALTQAVREPDGSVSNTNRDFVAQGLANLAGSLFQALPVGGSLSRTAVNINAGARTRLANLIAGLSIGLILLVLGPVVESITLAALAGHLIVAAISLIRPERIKIVWNVTWTARAAMIATFAATLLLPLEYSIYIGVGLSLALYLHTSSHSLIVEQLILVEGGRFRAAPLPPQLPTNEAIIINVRGSLYFAAVKHLESLLPPPRPQQPTIVIIRLRESHDLASTALRFLLQYQERLRQEGGDLLLAGLSEAVWQTLQQTNMVAKFGADNLYHSDNTYFGATETAYHAAMQRFLPPPTETDEPE